MNNQIAIHNQLRSNSTDSHSGKGANSSSDSDVDNVVNSLKSTVTPSTSPLNLTQFTADSKHYLLPPVCNRLLYGGPTVHINKSSSTPPYVSQHFQIQIVGGPNIRTDFHINATEEYFIQLKGDMLLKTIDGRRRRDVVIREGEAFLLPGNVPHSPQRLKETIGLVIEMKRPQRCHDTLRWYCSQCHSIIHDAQFELKDLTTQLKAAITDYYNNEMMRQCEKCGVVDEVPSVDRNSLCCVDDLIQATRIGWQQHNNELDSSRECNSINRLTHPDPYSFKTLLRQFTADNEQRALHETGCQYSIVVLNGPSAVSVEACGSEILYWCQRGGIRLKLNGVVDELQLKEKDFYLIPVGVQHSIEFTEAQSQVIQVLIQRFVEKRREAVKAFEL